MRLLTALAISTLLSGCNCGGLNCTPSTGDAGPQLRAQGEPCTDGAACAAGLRCLSAAGSAPLVQQECLASCGDAGVCPSGTACVDGDGRVPTACHPTCVTDADCPGRFATTCRAVDAGTVRGICAVFACSSSTSCPGTGGCVKQEYCCPPGAPCTAPRDGFCLR